MAQRVQILLEDDLDGSEASETVNFALDGKSYEIDLSAANAAQLRDDFAKWTGHARPVRGRGRGVAPTRSAGRTDLNKVREWGRKNGFKVSDRGRVSAEVQEAYARANA
ncbi:Lsr2 family protein [Flexivirga endophytica]|uniref:Lsr2 family protein n=1 Tax=Flexivirga endophytica TaxID=1849103 RepID=A0A916T1W0_9MICO|nr:Lsr2 family protein [Flexivirga endophytica]GGB27320.1 Lsr2 family protein [Flexivirga endophytica]GHB55800.1 Lsr2 family protein [Flexivirga endophytica]